jgi:hypothetical protein
MKTEEIEILQKNKIAKELKKEITSSCCNGGSAINEEASCQLEEDKKAANAVGCGCSTAKPKVKSSCC